MAPGQTSLCPVHSSQLPAVAHVSQPCAVAHVSQPAVCSGTSPNQLCTVAHVSQPAVCTLFFFHLHVCGSHHQLALLHYTNCYSCIRLLPGVEHTVLTPNILTCTLGHSLSKVGVWQVGVAPGQTSLCRVHSSQLPAVHAAD